MPHPTPYSRQFDAIRSAYPGLFERPGDEAPARTHAAGTDTATEAAADAKAGLKVDK